MYNALRACGPYDGYSLGSEHTTVLLPSGTRSVLIQSNAPSMSLYAKMLLLNRETRGIFSVSWIWGTNLHHSLSCETRIMWYCAALTAGLAALTRLLLCGSMS